MNSIIKAIGDIDKEMKQTLEKLKRMTKIAEENEISLP